MEDNQDIQQFNMDSSPITITKTFKKHFKRITLRPLSFFILLALIGLLLPSLLIPFWVLKIKGIEKELDSITNQSHQEIWSVIQNATSTLLPMSSSATNLAKVANVSLGEIDPTYFDIESKVAPILFQALLTIPRLSQISYVKQDGLFFALYSRDHQQIYAIYSNTSFIGATKSRKDYSWFKQPVASDTGKLYGEAVVFPPQLLFNDTWFQKALNTTDGCASLLKSLDHDNSMLVMNTARVDKNGVISLGFGLRSLIDVFSSSIKPFGGGLYLATKDGKELSDGIPNTHVVIEENTAISIQLMKANGDPSGTLQLNYKMPQAYILDILGTNYILYSSSVDIIGLQSVYVLVLPYDGVQSRMHKNIVFVLVLLLVMFVIVAVFIFHLVVLMARAARKEMCLKASLIRQKDATLQAERKSMNRSLAFASASHEIRTPLAGITSLVEMSINLVPEGSELAENLRLMNTCSERLYGILNSILDTSKIEAGEMQLEEKEFNLVKVVEDVVDLFYPVGLKKKVDVILDIQDPSLTKFSPVKGDEYRLQQILSNLVNNAIKFTKDGYVSVQAYARNPRLQHSTFDSTQDQPTSCLSCFFFKNDEKCKAIDERACLDTNFMEFVFEVNDTGIGIPKDKRASVFENYRQVQEAAPKEGTGLGLGIVQSIVRLMGGDISIVDKDGERGTCFKFNVFLKVCRNGISEDDMTPSLGNLSSGSNTPFRSPKRQDCDSSTVVLFITSDVRRKITQKFIRAHKIKVLPVENVVQLSETLQKFTQEEQNVSSSGSDLNLSFGYLTRPGSRHSNTSPKNIPLSAMDGTDVSPAQRTNRVAKSRFMLLVVDTSQADFDELRKEVAKFRKNSKNYCFRVVWLGSRSMKLHGLDEKQLPPSDVIISMPLHGTRLYSLLDLIPGFRGMIPSTPSHELTPQRQYEITNLRGMIPSTPPPEHTPPRRQDKISSLGGMIPCTPPHRQDEITSLSAKKVLVAEDDNVQLKITKMILLKHGFTVDMCRNGNEALTMVSQGLTDLKNHGASHTSPYDFILMDCQMPVMDGCEATRLIRLTENDYGVHIPIIGLTAHVEGEEVNKMFVAGIDIHVSKPLSNNKLLKVIQDLKL